MGRQGIPGDRRWRVTLALLASTALTHAAPALANPEGGVVVAGSATISETGPGRLDVDQHSDRAIIDWRSFDIEAGEGTRFRQPSANAVALNRVVGNDPSGIFGDLTANGRIYLVNPNGVVFGPGSRIDVGGLVATTADIRNADFMAGIDRFGTPSANQGARVVNQGAITVADRGLAALVAPGVENSGTITARLGQVELAGARTFTMDFHGDGLVSFDTGMAVEAASADALVVQSGTIDAAGGLVRLTANGMEGVVDRAIDVSGIVRAQSVGVENGRIVLSGGDSGRVTVTDRLDASGLGAGETGGTVEVLGRAVALTDEARIDVSGDAGGGTALIGGGYQGNGPQPNALRTYVGQDAEISADAVTAGDGGTVIAWADDATAFYGRISARGGAEGGDGGLVETSGKNSLSLVGGSVDTIAPLGVTGTWLIDPTDVYIESTTPSVPLDGVDDFLDPDSGPAPQTTIAVFSINNATSNVRIQATNNIILNAEIDMVNAGVGLTMEAYNDIFLNGDGSGSISISTNNGDVSLRAGLSNPSGGILGGFYFGDIDVGSATLFMQAGSGGIDFDGTTLTAARLGMDSTGPISLPGAHNVGTLATSSPGHDFSFANDQDLTIGTVNGVTGVSVAAFDLDVFGDIVFAVDHVMGGDNYIYNGVTDIVETYDVTFNGSIDGPYNLFVDTVGTVAFNGPVGGSSPLAGAVVGWSGLSGDGFPFDPSTLTPDNISSFASSVLNTSDDITVAGLFRATGGVIMTASLSGGSVTTGSNQSQAFDVGALYVDGESANVYGIVAGVDSVGAALVAKRPDPLFSSFSTPDDYKINNCTIGTSCPEPPSDFPEDPTTASNLPETLTDDNLTPPIQQFTLSFQPLIIAPSRIASDDQELFSNSGNEEVW
ncbi:filamentous hemagglutinin N-terminal domain-containing protein [Inquilinus sp. CAU 1745]|uniref:two-partner secretion domain-containing protein n=1 Tax=Inquilinus sp. CAU 1745 TaxID=3140369 RepID=UPI00325AF37B